MALLRDASMPSHHNEKAARTIEAFLARMIAERQPPPPWAEAWSRLGPQSSAEDRLAVYQAVRHDPQVPTEVGHYLVAWQLDGMIDFDDEPEAARGVQFRIDAIRRAHGLAEDELWYPGEGPPEYLEAVKESHAISNAVFADKLEAIGESDMAELLRTDPARYDALDEAGRTFIHGALAEEDPKAWLDELLDIVNACVVSTSGPMGPLQMLVREKDESSNIWDLFVFPTPVELIGGAHDGSVVTTWFNLDLERLRAAFDTVVEFVWDTHGWCDQPNPHVVIEGVFQGREVMLEVVSYPPEDVEPGLKVDTNQRPPRPE
jgi:hypothetical protein